MAYCHPMVQKSDSRDLDKVIVRLPDGMRDRIKAAAEHNGRSMNAEIVQALDYWLAIEIHYEVELGPGTDAQKVGRADWEDVRKGREEEYRKEIQRSIWLMQGLLRDLKVSPGRHDERAGGDSDTDVE